MDATGRLVVPRRDATGMAYVHLLSTDEVSAVIEEVVCFVDGEGDKEVRIAPPWGVTRRYIGFAEKGLPVLRGVIQRPTITVSGRVVSTPGYDSESGLFLMLPVGVEWLAVPENPSKEDVEGAVHWLRDLFGQFPFVDESDLTHVIALLVSLVARAIIGGPVPLFVVAKSRHGEGGTLIIEIVGLIVLGQVPPALPFMAGGEEGQKTLMAVLDEAPELVFLDNLERLDSGPFASAITASTFTSRRLRTSKMARATINAVFTATATAPSWSREIARRVVAIRLDSKTENPARRVPEGGWRHPNIKQYALQNRPYFLFATLVLVRSWIAAGMPTSNAHLGSFEGFASRIGGILEHAGLDGFLAHQAEVADEHDVESEAVAQLFSLWWLNHQDKIVGAKDVLALIEHYAVPLHIPGGNAHARSVKVGFILKKWKNVTVAGYTLRRAGTETNHSADWYMEKQADEAPPGAEAES